MDTLTVALASLGGVVIAGVIAQAHGMRAAPGREGGGRVRADASAVSRRDEPGLDER